MANIKNPHSPHHIQLGANSSFGSESNGAIYAIFCARDVCWLSAGQDLVTSKCNKIL